ncbi:MAG TPA: class I SAM-dependent methyltransferase [Ktedonobacterales bacterium]|jgi:SAM-dependent methyltransferase
MTTNAYSSLWFQLFMPLQTEEWTGKDVAFLARQLPLPRYQRLLDLCCGYGRHALPLAGRGYQVTGLDRDAAAIAEAQQRTARAGQAITYLIADMRQVGEVPGAFDAVINMWQSFCYFDEATNIDLLRQMHRKLTPGGRFIIDMYNRAFYERQQGSQRREINGIIVESNTYLQDRRLHSVLRYLDEAGERGGDHFDFQMFTPDEFSALAAACGFTPRLVCTWADENIAPSSDVARMQIVLEKTTQERAPQ